MAQGTASVSQSGIAVGSAIELLTVWFSWSANCTPRFIQERPARIATMGPHFMAFRLSHGSISASPNKKMLGRTFPHPAPGGEVAGNHGTIKRGGER
jgi:hypothetical protein